MRVFYSLGSRGSELKRRVFGGYMVRQLTLVNGVWKYAGKPARFKTERDAVTYALSMI